MTFRNIYLDYFKIVVPTNCWKIVFNNNLLLFLVVVVKAMPDHAVTAVCMISSVVCPQLDV